MKKSDFLTIKAKLTTVAIGIAFIWIALGIFLYLHLERITRYEHFTTEMNDFTVNIIQLRKAENNFLLFEQKNLYFYHTGKSKYIKNFNDYYIQSNSILNDLLSDELAKNYLLKDKLRKLRVKLENYYETFHKLVINTRERGYREYGLIGDMEEAVQNLEYFVSSFDESSFLNEKILILRKYEKDFLSQKDLSLRDNLYSTIETYKQFFRDVRTTLTQEQTNEFIRLLDEYKANFDLVVQKERKIGLTANDGLTGETQEIIESLEKDVNVILNEIKTKNRRGISTTKNRLFYSIILLAISVVVILLLISRSIISPIAKIKDYISELVKGKFPEPVSFTNQDEIADMGNSLNSFVENLRKKAIFSEKIGKGDLNAEIVPASEDDTLGDSLLQMRESLKKADREEQKRKIEDQKIAWSTEGLTKFNDILQKNIQDIPELSYEIIKNLVDFIGANQGGIFIYNDEVKSDIHLELVACYAYNKRKKLKRKVLPREGLVGMCAVEKATTVVDDIPDDYLLITSGLGKATPKYLLVVPMMLNELLFGVIEIASFEEFEDYKIKFVERLAENIAASLSITQTNIKTKKLLVKFQHQSEDLAAKEEELRQNLEELKSTQEHMDAQQEYLTSLKHAIDESFILAEYSIEGEILQINERYTLSTEYNQHEVLGKNIKDYISSDQKVDFDIIWDDLMAGQSHHDVIKSKSKTGVDKWYAVSYTPIKNPEGQIIRVIYLADDITDFKKQEFDLRAFNKKLEERIRELENQIKGQSEE